VALAVCTSALADEGGGLVGWVESTRGAPLGGAVVSIFGKGIRGGSLITLADSQGQFVLPSLPAGSYTLRAIGLGHQPSAAQQVTVLPNRDALFTLSLDPVGEKPAATESEAASEESLTESQREWRWLVRHKRRSVLETDEQQVEARVAPALEAEAAPTLADMGPLAGSMELAATTGARTLADHAGRGLPGGVGSLRLEGRLADGVRWSLGGLVAESEGRAWRTAAEFVLEPGGGHELQVGAGYGEGDTRPDLSGSQLAQPSRNLGAAFARDRWRLGERLTAVAGARYTYIGFLPDSHHADAVVQVELRGDARTLVHGSVATRTLAPGGDLLTLSTVAASPAITWAKLGEDLRPARSRRLELGVDHSLGAGRLGATLFDETTADILLTTFDGRTPSVRNAGSLGARGFGVTLGGSFGGVVNGSVTYTFGQGRRVGESPVLARVPLTSLDEAEFHDLVARLETVIGWSDTRLAALCRLNALSENRGAGAGGPSRASTATRFDVQLTQGLPFLEPLTRADWEVLVAVRNMFYEASQAGFLDELAVQDPPTRVVGGIAVRF
jgi:hypothetical protein